MISTNEIKEKGVVGAGGAGFPTYVKFSSEAEILIVNAAECEPLLHKDMEILLRRTDDFLRGLSIAAKLTSAQKVIIGIKKKHDDVISHLETRLPGSVEISPVKDFYPAGDEITLIYETTGRVVAPGKLPITQNVIVSNVETLYNLAKDGPVTTKFLNIVGEVQNPVTVEVPIGTPIGEVLEIARPMLERFQLVVGGPMMGRIAENLEEPVTKTTG
jgi:Na+-translocating ferredoxin:NAD+ oxidoreductase RnfC subunit